VLGNPLINDSQEIKEPVLMLNLCFARIIELVSTFDWVIIIGKYLGKECKCLLHYPHDNFVIK